MRHFEEHPFTEHRYADVPDGALCSVDLRGRRSCWFRKGRASVHPNRITRVAVEKSR